jgi:hypothetical protein
VFCTFHTFHTNQLLWCRAGSSSKRFSIAPPSPASQQKIKRRNLHRKKKKKTVNLPPLASAFLQHTKRQLFYGLLSHCSAVTVEIVVVTTAPRRILKYKGNRAKII